MRKNVCTNEIQSYTYTLMHMQTHLNTACLRSVSLLFLQALVAMHVTWRR